MVEAGSGNDRGEEAFTRATEGFRREIHAHCYRMLGSFDEAEDLVQETYLRAWRAWATFDGAAPRAWLYRIATNACLDFLARAARGEIPQTPTIASLPWLQPYPDRLLDDLLVERETIELAYLAALQFLVPRQRAVLLLREVVGFDARETAAALGLSPPAVHSALQRARASLERHRPLVVGGGAATMATPSDAERRLVARFVDACERYDVEAMVALARDDIRMTAPPDPRTWEGREAFREETEEGFGAGAPGVVRCLVTRANRQPAVAVYLRRWDDTVYRPFVLDVLRVEDGLLVDLTGFHRVSFSAFGLPAELLEESPGHPTNPG